MSFTSRLTNLAAAGANKEAGWILTVEDPSAYGLNFFDIDKRDGNQGNGNLIVAGNQYSTEDGVLLEIDTDGNIVNSHIQNNNVGSGGTYYNTVWEHYGSGTIYTGGFLDNAYSWQGLTQFSSPSNINYSKNFDISGGSGAICKPHYLSYDGKDYHAIVGARSSALAFCCVSTDFTTALSPRYYNPRGTNLLVSLAYNGANVAMCVETYDNNIYKLDIYSVSAVSPNSSSWAKSFYVNSTYYTKPCDSQGYNGMEFYYSNGDRGICAFNTNAWGTSQPEGAGILMLDGNGNRTGDPTFIVNVNGSYQKTTANGCCPDEVSTEFYKDVYSYGQVNNEDAWIVRHTGYNGSIRKGLRIHSTTGDYIELSGATSREGAFMYAAGWYVEAGTRYGIVMKLPKDLFISGTFDNWVISSPLLSQSNMGFYEESGISLNYGTFNAGSNNASTTLSTYSPTTTLSGL
jgi:hypothetical protein